MIDVAAHILPRKYIEKLAKVVPQDRNRTNIGKTLPTLFDIEHRIRIMEKYGEMTQVLTISNPPIEAVADPDKAVDLARLANDEMAQIIYKYPDYFVAAVACLPMNDLDAAINEADRAIRDLKFRGIQLATSITGKPLDAPEFFPIYEKMERYNLPIWIHPFLHSGCPEYPTERSSKYHTDLVFGWLHETTVAMARMAFSGIFERYPNLKIITHHAGAMIPLAEHRIINSYNLHGFGEDENQKQKLTRSPVESLKMFYCDTALNGNTAGLMAARAFFGIDHMLFGTDTPFDSQLGNDSIRMTIESIEQMDIPEAEKKQIYEENTRRLLRLPS